MNPQYINIKHHLLALLLLLSWTFVHSEIAIKSTNFDVNISKGAVEFIINGNAGPFDYAVINKASGQSVGSGTVQNYDASLKTINDLDKGEYFLRVKTKLECIFDYPFEIKECELKSLPPIVTQACGDEKGTAKAAYEFNGTDEPTFTWEDENKNIIETKQEITNLEPGKYCVTVKAGGCEVKECISINSFPELSVKSSGTPVSLGFPNGSVSFLVTGGKPTYNWTLVGDGVKKPNGTGETASESGLKPGLYTFTVKDANGCEKVAVQEVVNCENLTNAFNVTTKVISECPLKVEFEYPAQGMYGLEEQRIFPKWIDIITPTGTRQILEGKYCIKIISKGDGGFCGLYAFDEVIKEVCYEPACGFDFDRTEIDCDGKGKIGVINATGCAPFTYLWSHTDEDKAEVEADGSLPRISVRVIDANGCSVVKSIDFGDPTKDIRVTDLCNGEGKACMEFYTADKANQPYTVEYTHNGITKTTTESYICNLEKGDYDVVITDAFGCEFSKTVNVPEANGELEAVYDVVPCQTSQTSDGVINFTITKGTGALSYVLSGSQGFFKSDKADLDKALTFSNLKSGVYTLFIRDEHCTKRYSIEVYYCEQILQGRELVVSPTYDAYGSDCGKNPLDINFEFFDAKNSIVATVNGTPSFSYQLLFKGKPIRTGNLSSGSGPLTLGGIVDAGTYSLVISDGRPCTYTYNLQVKTVNTGGTGVNEAFWKVTGKVKNITIFCGEGSITLNPFAAGFNKGLKYSWAGPDGFKADTKDIEGLTKAGGYYVAVTDPSCNDKAVISEIFNVSKTGGSGIESEVKHSCKVGGTGGISLKTDVLDNSLKPFTFQWQEEREIAPHTGMDNVIRDLVKGKYSVTITSSKGCSVEMRFEIKESTEMKVVATTKSEPCRYYINPSFYKFGWITKAVNGGSPPYTGTWYYGKDDSYSLGNEISKVYNNLLNIEVWSLYHYQAPSYSNFYKLAIKDANNCTFDAFEELSSRLEVESDITGLCNGQTTGEIKLITKSNNSDPLKPVVLKYQWTDDNLASPKYTDTRTNLPSGLYKVLVTDGECKLGLEFNIKAPSQAFEFQAVTTTAETTPNVSKDGSFSTNIIGDSPFSYNVSGANGNIFNKKGTINNSGETLLLDKLKSGFYWLTVKDEAGCEYSKVFEIEKCLSITIQSETVRQNICDNTFNLIKTTTTGGTLPYLYKWNDNTKLKDLSISKSGVYTLTVTDNNGCKATKEFTINSLQPIINVGSCGIFPTTVMVNQTNAKYQWDDGVANFVNRKSDLGAGKHTVTITSLQGNTACVYDFELFDVVSSIKETCNDPYSATINLNDNNGTFTFQWLHNNSKSNTVTVNATGTYNVKVTNIKTGCSTNKQIKVDYFDANDIIVTTPKCKKGEVTISTKNDVLVESIKLNGVVLPHAYWRGEPILIQGTGKEAILELKDLQSCTITKKINFESYEPMELVFVKKAVCKPSNGEITVTVPNRTQSLFYDWSDGQRGNNKNIITANTNNQYNLTVTDSDGCTAKESVKYEDADFIDLDFKISIFTQTACKGSPAQISVSVLDIKSSEESKYTYLWNNGAPSKILPSMPTNQLYTVTVTHTTSGCTRVAETNNDKIVSFDYGYKTIDACGGRDNGKIVFDTPPIKGPKYEYRTKNSSGQYYYSTEGILTGLAPGDYDVTITATIITATNDQVCQTVRKIKIQDFKATQTVTVTKVKPCFGENTGSLSLDINFDGTFLWDNGMVTPKIENLAAGNYCVSIIDSRCGAITPTPTCFELEEDAEISEPPCFKICGGKKRSVIDKDIKITNITPCNGSKHSVITLEVGASPISYTITNTDNSKSENGQGLSSFTIDLSNLEDATKNLNNYKLVVTNASGCTSEKSFSVMCCSNITPSDPIEKFTVRPTKGTRKEGSIVVELKNTNLMIFWTSPTGNTIINPNDLNQIGLSKGKYTLTVLGFGCQPFQKTFEILDKDQDCTSKFPPLGKSIIDQCPIFDCQSGEIKYIFTDVDKFSFTWTNGQTGKEIKGLRKGLYTVLLTHKETGCVKVDMPEVLVVTVRPPEPTGKAICEYKTFGCGNNCPEKIVQSSYDNLFKPKAVEPDNPDNCQYYIKCKDDPTNLILHDFKLKRDNCSNDIDCYNEHPNWVCAIVTLCEGRDKDDKVVFKGKKMPQKPFSITEKPTNADCRKEWYCEIPGIPRVLLDWRLEATTLGTPNQVECYTPVLCGNREIFRIANDKKYCYDITSTVLSPNGGGFIKNYNLYTLDCKGIAIMPPIDIVLGIEPHVPDGNILLRWRNNLLIGNNNIPFCGRPSPPPVIDNKTSLNTNEGFKFTTFQKITVYPNPFDEIINVKIDLLEKENLELNIFDTFGRQLLHEKMKTYEAGVTLLNITPDVWATGIFFLEVKSQNGEAQRYKLSNIK